MESSISAIYSNSKKKTSRSFKNGTPSFDHGMVSFSNSSDQILDLVNYRPDGGGGLPGSIPSVDFQLSLADCLIGDALKVKIQVLEVSCELSYDPPTSMTFALTFMLTPSGITIAPDDSTTISDQATESVGSHVLAHEEFEAHEKDDKAHAGQRAQPDYTEAYAATPRGQPILAQGRPCVAGSTQKPASHDETTADMTDGPRQRPAARKPSQRASWLPESKGEGPIKAPTPRREKDPRISPTSTAKTRILIPHSLDKSTKKQELELRSPGSWRRRPDHSPDATVCLGIQRLSNLYDNRGPGTQHWRRLWKTDEKPSVSFPPCS
ncbi:hypothetical protein Nepgr_020269 [Nepenthes gracilis]|uniref:Uncharacterized protein n=1 Tax=Nepenthes gracilis TaxID=150966 RepID=A0AAD3SVR3_NEPGR|nr:hypothetical protein Nepgr_020269 [Nepenthes gracilis]